MEKEYLIRLMNMDGLDEEEFLDYVIDDLNKEFPELSPYKIESIDGLYLVGLGDYSCLLSADDLSLLMDEDDPYGLDRYLLAHYLVAGLELQLDQSNYIKNIFAIYNKPNVIRVNSKDLKSIYN